MDKRNNDFRDYLGVTAWHEAGYTGDGVKALTAENFGSSTATEHSKQTKAVFEEIAPMASLEYVGCEYLPLDAFAEKLNTSNAQVMFWSKSVSNVQSTIRADIDRMFPKNLTIFCSAGNYAEDDYNALITPEAIYGVGACEIKWSRTVNGKPSAGATRLVYGSDFSSVSEFVDFAAPSGLYALGRKFEGTSCAAPVLCGVAALIQEFAMQEVKRHLNRDEMYRCLMSLSYDIYADGKDEYTGFGVPILPSPYTFSVKPYIINNGGNAVITAKELIKAAEAETGVKEQPVNKVVYNTAYYGYEVSGNVYSWCAVFVWWLFHSLGADAMYYGGGKTASCTTLYNYYDRLGKTIHKDYKAGDIVFFDWDSSGDCDHIGIIVDGKDGEYTTIEGNTAIGNDSNGGEVMHRVRYDYQIRGAYRPDYKEEKMTVKELINAMTDEEAYQIIVKAQRHAATLPAPAWAEKELAEAKNKGVTDGTSPMKLATRLETALMANRR